jgi:cell division protein FtsN
MAAAYEQAVPMRIRPGTALKVPYSGSDGAFVQAGAFADPANADRAVARLMAAGLPAARSRGMIGGRTVAFVLAGPVDRSLAAQALAAVRAAGFADAYLR